VAVSMRFPNHILVVVIVVAICMLGCGKKDDPLPPDIKFPGSANNLRVERTNFGTRVSWQMPESETSLKSVKIQRSDVETLRNDCPGCPRNYVMIGDYLVNDPILVKDGTSLSYADTNVRSGWLYTYRIVLCNRAGHCSDPSDPSEIKY
jgi:hypothetical protein